MAQKEKYIRQRPDGRWEVRMKIGVYSDGKTYAPSRYFASRADARKYVQKVLADRQSAVISRYSLLEWADKAAEIYGGGLQDHTQINLQRQKRMFLAPYPIAMKRLDEVKTVDLQSWLGQLRRHDGKPYSSSSQLTAIAYIRWLFTKAVESEVISALPNFASLKKPHRKRPRLESTLTPEVAKTIVEASKGHRLHNALVVCSLTGLRRSELLGLKWADINMATGDYAIRQKVTYDIADHTVKIVDKLKTANAARIGKLPPAALAALKDQRKQNIADRLKVGQFYEDNDLVFPGPMGEPLNPQSFTVFCERISQEAIGKNIGPHQYRHMVATILIRAHLDDITIANALGHSSANFTRDQYAEFYADSREAVSQVMERFGEDWVKTGSTK